MVDPGFYFDGPRFFLEILVDPGLVDPGSEKLSFTLPTTKELLRPGYERLTALQIVG